MTANVDAAIEALARIQESAFSRTQAKQKGATDGLIHRRVKQKRWIRDDGSVYLLPGPPRTFRQRLFVATLGTPGSYVSGDAAALELGLDGVKSARVEITAPRTSGRRSGGRRGLVHHREPPEPEDVILVRGLPVASAARTIADLAGRYDVDALERMYESAGRKGLIVPADLDAVVERFARPGTPGAVQLRMLQDRIVRDGAVNGSDLETIWFQLVRSAGLPLPVRQRLIVRPDGKLAFADYAWPGLEILVELEGYTWHSSPLAHLDDVERNNALVLLGWTVVRFTWWQVTHDPAYVIRVITALVGAAAA